MEKMRRDQKHIKLRDTIAILIAWLIALFLAYSVFLKFRFLFR